VVYGVKVVHKRRAQDLAQYLVASCFLHQYEVMKKVMVSFVCVYWRAECWLAKVSSM